MGHTIEYHTATKINNIQQHGWISQQGCWVWEVRHKRIQTWDAYECSTLMHVVLFKAEKQAKPI